jgi:polyisoprenyl-phosphate glycosyltransferase
MSEPAYSVVVPVFNSETSLKDLNDRIHAVFQELNASFEIIFVEDGSKDNSWKVLTEIKTLSPETITAIKLAKNFGQHNATFCGLNYAKGKIIITIDDDLQILPEEIKKIIECHMATDSDLVYGSFSNKKHSLFRNIGSKLVKRSAKFFNDYPGEGSSFRLFSIELAQKILSHSQNFVFIDELLLWYTDNISFIKVEHHQSRNKHSGYTKTKLFQLTANLIIYYSILPLRIMTWGGFIFSVLSFLVGVFYLVKKIVFHHASPGYTSIIVAILFSTSIIIFSLGIIGEYLNRIYMVQNKKPPYSIKKVI